MGFYCYFLFVGFVVPTARFVWFAFGTIMLSHAFFASFVMYSVGFLVGGTVELSVVILCTTV